MASHRPGSLNSGALFPAVLRGGFQNRMIPGFLAQNRLRGGIAGGTFTQYLQNQVPGLEP